MAKGPIGETRGGCTWQIGNSEDPSSSGEDTEDVPE
jgi:hypothetical protein